MKPHIWFMDPSGELQFAHNTPDYLNDLNAMHEAEKMLPSPSHWISYSSFLEPLCQDSVGFFIHATAAQRAEAFLRTLNLWENAE
jgi:hypothetical protein